MVRVKQSMKEHRNRFSMFSLLHICIRLSGKTDHRYKYERQRLKSVLYLPGKFIIWKLTHFTVVFHVAWLSPQMGHIACKGIMLRSLSYMQAHNTTSSCFLRHLQPVLLYIWSLELRPPWPERYSLDIFLQLSVMTTIWSHVAANESLTLWDLYIKRWWKRQSGKQGRDQQWLLQTLGDSITLLLQVQWEEQEFGLRNVNLGSWFTTKLTVRAEVYHCHSRNYTSWLPQNRNYKTVAKWSFHKTKLKKKK